MRCSIWWRSCLCSGLVRPRGLKGLRGGARGLSLSPAGSLVYVCQMGEGFGFRQLSNFSRGKKKSKKLVSTPSQRRNNFFFQYVSEPAGQNSCCSAITQLSPIIAWEGRDVADLTAVAFNCCDIALWQLFGHNRFVLRKPPVGAQQDGGMFKIGKIHL